MGYKTEVDVIIRARIDLAEAGVNSIEELNELLDEADDVTVEICTPVDEDKAFTLMNVSIEEE